MYKILIKSSFFHGLLVEQIENILVKTHHNFEEYHKNDIVHLSGELVTMLKIVIKGCVRGEIIDQSGKIFRMEDICAPREIAPGFIFGSYNNFPVNVIANEDTEILCISKDSLILLMHQNEIICTNMLNILSDKTQYLALKIKSIFLQNIEGKIASFLLDIANKKGSLHFELDKSQFWLAERFNVARPSIARVFSEMKNKGYISIVDKNVKIINPKALRNCINQI